ncbi:MAG: GNAT family N-acetyltransferase [Chloroflexota bacterium]
MASTFPLPRDLGNNLVLRWATPKDIDAIVSFNAKIHSDHGPDKPDERVGAWTRDLMGGGHPTCRAGDFTVVEDIASGEIVSSLNLISQTWSYEGIPFKVGRPELVGTLPEYRNRGLVRAQFDAIHAVSAERGEMVQAITGIPYYYRIFGYEMALDLGGGRAGFLPQIPKLKEGEREPYHLRPAVETDLPWMADLSAQGAARSPIRCLRDESQWKYELLGTCEMNVNRSEFRIIETPAGEAVGYLAHPPFTWGTMMVAQGYEVKSDVSWAAVTPSVIRYLQATGVAYPNAFGENEPFEAFGFWLGAEHPVYRVIPDRLPRIRPPYAFYMRVPDLPTFLHHIAPALEKRLADSLLAGYTGEVRVTFYRGGLRLGFENGRLIKAEDYQPAPVGHEGEAAFPERTFLQVLFGRRSLEELRYMFADCWTNNEDTAVLLDTLFPRRASNVWPFS